MVEPDDAPKPGADTDHGVRDAVLEEVDEARRGIFSAYIRARQRGVVIAGDEDAADEVGGPSDPSD